MALHVGQQPSLILLLWISPIGSTSLSALILHTPRFPQVLGSLQQKPPKHVTHTPLIPTSKLSPKLFLLESVFSLHWAHLSAPSSLPVAS